MIRNRPAFLPVVALLILVLAGCGSDQAPQDQNEALASFVLEIPAEVTVGEPFALTVRAVSDGGADPFAGFEGAVELRAEGAVLTPAVVTLSAGVGAVQAVLAGPFGGPVTLTATAAGASGTGRILRVLLTGLPGAPDDDAGDSVPDLPVEPRPEDYAAGHPELGDAGVSVNLIWIAFAPGTTVAQADAVIAAVDAVIVGGARPVAVLRLPTTTHAAMNDALALLRADPRVAHAAPDMLGGGAVLPRDNGGDPADWAWENQPAGGNWWLEQVRAPQLWNLRDHAARRGPRPFAAVIDVGTASHPDLLFGGPTANVKHGTHVAGIMAARFDNGVGVDGINPLGAGWLVVVTSHNTVTLPGAASRVSWIQTYTSLLSGLMDSNAADVRVINMSLGYNWYLLGIEPLQNLAARTIADAHGAMLALMLAAREDAVPALIVVAAGNESDASGVDPAEFSSPMTNAALVHGAAQILVVENVGRDAGTVPTAREISSCDGGHVSAPGTDILSTVPGGYDIMTGTSMASPVVAGLATFLCALEPSLTNAELRELLADNAEPAGGGAADCVDAFASALDIDRLRDGSPVLAMLLDLDDGSPDGNLRRDPETGDAVEDRDLDGDGGEGDGRVDMSDFRCWRDAVLQLEGTGGLDGDAAHPKKDLNRDQDVGAAADENLAPRADFNGDGVISRTAARHVPGDVDAEVTDLQLLQRLFDDPHYAAADLPGLIDSGDLAVDPADLLAAPDAARVRVTIRDAGSDALVQTRDLSTADRAVFTLPAPAPSAGCKAQAVVFDAAGGVLRTVPGDPFGLVEGEDRFWKPQAVQTLVVELTVPEQADPGEAFPILVRAGVRDGEGPVAYTGGITVALQVSGGSLASGGGLTDADGAFDTEATPTETAQSVTVFCTASLEGLADVTATATVSLATAYVVVDGLQLFNNGQSYLSAGALALDYDPAPDGVADQDDCARQEAVALDLSGPVLDQHECSVSATAGRGWATASAATAADFTPTYDATSTYLQQLAVNVSAAAAADGSCVFDEGATYHSGTAGSSVRAAYQLSLTVEQAADLVVDMTGDGALSIHHWESSRTVWQNSADPADEASQVSGVRVPLQPGTYSISFRMTADASTLCSQESHADAEDLMLHVALRFHGGV